MRTEYVLMNQTVPMLRFSCERNIFDEPEFEEIEWLTELRPIGYGNLNDFLTRRQASRNLCDVSGYRDVANSEKTSETTETNLLSPALPGFVKENYRKTAVFLNAFYRKIAECLAFPSSQPLLIKLTSITETNRAAYGAGSLI